LGTKLIQYAWLFAVIFVFVFSVLPSSDSQDNGWIQIYQLDKLFHYISHAAIVILYFIPKIIYQKAHLNNKTMLGIFLALLVYGIAIELIQKYIVTNRYFDPLDIAANILGDLTGIAVTKYIKHHAGLKRILDLLRNKL